jgi:ABC-type polysaccharide/polyol phosphate transport system ATPase subunit
MKSTNAVSVENLSKSFKIPHEKRYTLRDKLLNFTRNRTFETFKVLDDISFNVQEGDFFGILGRNGSGKSTLLKLLAGIYTTNEGKITTKGAISPFLELGVGFNPELSGHDNIYYNGMILGLTRKEINRKYDSIVEFSELERFIDQKLKNYSSGMYVRLAFSMAVHANKEIILLDEVLAVGDLYFQQKCLRELHKLKESGKTIILVSHDMEAVKSFCVNGVLLEGGKITARGEIGEICLRYTESMTIEAEQEN